MVRVYLDTETSGLNPDTDIVWEVAWAVGDGPVKSGFIDHSADVLKQHSNDYGLTVGGFKNRYDKSQLADLDELRRDLKGNTLTGANPAFDAGFLSRLLGSSPWHYRLLDVEAYVMLYFGHDTPQGLHTAYRELFEAGYDLTAPDHTAVNDVLCTRDIFNLVRELY